MRSDPNLDARTWSEWEDDDPTAQDVIDALRFALMAQKDTAERVRLYDALLEFAPETESDRGLKMIVRLIAEGSLKVSMVQDASEAVTP